MPIQLQARPCTGPAFELEHDGPEFFVGRHHECELSFDPNKNDGVSLRHAQFRLDSTQATIIDLGSTNGTFLNGRRLTPNQPEPLAESDEIRFGLTGPTVRVTKLSFPTPKAKGSSGSSRGTPAQTSTRAMLVEYQQRNHQFWAAAAVIFFLVSIGGATTFFVLKSKLAGQQGELANISQKTEAIGSKTDQIGKDVKATKREISNTNEKLDDATERIGETEAKAEEAKKKAMEAEEATRTLKEEIAQQVAKQAEEFQKKMEELAERPPAFQPNQPAPAVGDDKWEILSKKATLVTRSGKHWAGQLMSMQPKEVRFRVNGQSATSLLKAQEVGTVCLFDDIYSYNDHSKCLESRFAYYSLDEKPGLAIRIPSRNRKSFATGVWPAYVQRSSGQIASGIMCSLHNGRRGLGLFDEVAGQIPLNQIEAIYTAEGIHYYVEATKTLALKPLSEIQRELEEKRREEEEKRFQIAMNFIKMAEKGFEWLAERERKKPPY